MRLSLGVAASDQCVTDMHADERNLELASFI